MEFFNKKEEVIDLQLTQYGKHLLSMGRFKPVYYAFYDDGILYDSEYGGFTEAQNEAKNRIQNNTPNLKTQYVFHDLDRGMGEASEILYNTENIEIARKTLQATPERNQILVRPIGTSEAATSYMPAWRIGLLSGQFLTASISPTLTLSGSNTILEIPQIGANITYNVSVDTIEQSPTQEMVDAIARGDIDGVPQALLEQQLSGSEGYSDINYDLRVFDDNTYLKVQTEDLLLHINEDNVDMSLDNYEIEVFEVEDVPDAQGNLVTQLSPLKFVNDPDLVVGGILLDEEDLQRDEVDINSSFANYYLDIETDNEISAELICSKLKNADKSLQKFIVMDFDCPDKSSTYQFLNPYAQKAEDEDCGGDQ